MTDLAELAGQAKLDVSALRREFPILAEHVNGYPVAYLDNAATTQKPEVVIEAISNYYRHANANVHRGVHTLSQRATEGFDGVRATLARFVGAEPNEVVFTKGSTEAINLVASSWGRTFLKPGDRILVSELEHHANILPWQMVAAEKGIKLEPIPVRDDLSIDLESFANFLDERVKLVAVCHVSNAVGTINPIATITEMAHKVGALVMVDGAQGLSHGRVDVKALGADFYSIAAHKVFAPTGLGALVARKELLDAMPPYQRGGGIILKVTFEGSTFMEAPEKFEPGTPNIADVFGLGAALNFLTTPAPWSDGAAPIDLFGVQERALLNAAHAALAEIPGVRVHGNPPEQAGIVSFTMDAAHPHDIGTILDGLGVAIRTGHHCCQPLMRRIGVPATARASFAPYNTLEEVERLAAGLRKVNEVFA